VVERYFSIMCSKSPCGRFEITEEGTAVRGIVEEKLREVEK